GRSPIQRQTISIVSCRKSRQIGDVLAERQVTVYRQIRERPVCVVLRSKSLTGSLEVIEVFFSPPVCEAARSVKLAALIVKAVADLVTDRRANRSVILRGVRF